MHHLQLRTSDWTQRLKPLPRRRTRHSPDKQSCTCPGASAATWHLPLHAKSQANADNALEAVATERRRGQCLMNNLERDTCDCQDIEMRIRVPSQELRGPASDSGIASRGMPHRNMLSPSDGNRPFENSKLLVPPKKYVYCRSKVRRAAVTTLPLVLEEH